MYNKHKLTGTLKLNKPLNKPLNSGSLKKHLDMHVAKTAAKKKTKYNDPTAYAIGYRFAVLDRSGACLELFSNFQRAVKSANRVRGQVVHVTGNKDTISRSIQRNGVGQVGTLKAVVRRNPIDEFTPPDTYRRPTETIEKVKESFSPGVRQTKNLATSPIKYGTDWPVPDDIIIPVPEGLSYFPHQRAAIIGMARRGNVLLADEQGLGKTIEIIGYMNLLKPTKTVICGPLSMIDVWVDELSKWAVKKYKVVIFRKGKFFTTKVSKQDILLELCEDQDKPEYDVLVTSFSALRSKEPKKISEEEKKRLEAEEEGNEEAAANEPKKRGRKKKSEQQEKTVSLSDIRISPAVRGLARKIERGGIDLIVLDEVHKLKTAVSKTAYAFFGEPQDPETGESGYPGLATAATKKIYASGTPLVGDKPEELYHILNSLDNKNWISEGLFTEYFGMGRKKKGEAQGTQKNLSILGVKMRDTVMIRRTAGDVITLPPMINSGIVLEETKEIEHARRLEEDAIIEMKSQGVDYLADLEDSLINLTESQVETAESKMEDKLTDIISVLNDKSMSAEEKAEFVEASEVVWEAERGKYSRKIKIPIEKMSETRRVMGFAKAMQTRYILEQIDKHRKENPGVMTDKMVIFYHHEQVLSTIVKELHKAGYEDDQMVILRGSTQGEARVPLVKKFQNDKNVKIFLGSILSAGAGITLTKSNVSIFIEQDWTPGNVQQAQKRTHRIGQVSSVAVFEFFAYARKTVDENMFNVLRRKEYTQREVLDTFPTETNIETYEKGFKESDIPGAKYQLSQRYAILTSARKVLGAVTENGVAVPNSGLSHVDISKLERLCDEAKKNTYTYGYSEYPIRHPAFPEDYLTDVLPILWKKKGYLTNKQREACEFPDWVTGFSRGEFRMLRDYDMTVPALRYFSAAVSDTHRAMRALKAAERRAAKGKGKEDEDELEELRRIAEENAED